MRGVIRGKCGSETYHVDGREVTREEFFRLIPPAPQTGGAGPGLIGWKPIASEALAVHPSQVKEAEAHAHKIGIPTEYLPDGRPVLTSRSHRAAFLRAHGFYDRQAGYGDPAPNHERKHEVNPNDYDY